MHVMEMENVSFINIKNRDIIDMSTIIMTQFNSILLLHIKGISLQRLFVAFMHNN